MGTPLLSGDGGVEQTINAIREIVDDAVKDPVVNQAAIAMVRGVGDHFSRDQKAQMIYNAVAARWLYVEDPVGPFGPKETLRPVRLLLQTYAGDCDDASVFIASLLGTIGIPSRVVTIAADPGAPQEFSHIYPEAEVLPGRWMAMDVARPGSAYGVPAPRAFRKRVWSLTQKTYTDLSGSNKNKKSCGCGGSCCGNARPSSLNGYALLGDDSSIADDIAAAGSTLPGIAQIVSAAQGNPVYPYASFGAGGLIPATGYPTGASLTANISPGTIMAVAAGVLLLAFMGKR